MAEPISAACGAWDDLWGAGFPDPVLGNTGNGTHLLYPVDLPNDSDKYALAKQPKKRPLHARQETAGMTARARSDGEILVKARGLLQYLRRDGPTDGTDPAFKRQTNDQLLQGLVLTPKSSDLRRNFHLSRAFEVFALQRGQRERGLCNSMEK
jgi:hypothetical protein